MTRRVAAIVWSDAGLRLARGTWRAGRLENVTVQCTVRLDPAELDMPIERDTALAVVLPSTETGRRIVTVPFRRSRILDEVVGLETRGSLPVDPGPLRVVWEALPDSARDSTRVVAGFARESTLRSIAERLGAVGAAALRIDGAPMPVWSLVDDPRQTAVVLRDRDGVWVTAVASDHRPLFARPLHADRDDPQAIAAEVAHTFATWGVAPARILLAGPTTDSYGDAVSAACMVPCESLMPDPALGGALADDPLLAGALLAVARRTELPLALIAPAPVPRRQRRRLGRLAIAAVLLAGLFGALHRIDLAQRAEALETGIATVVGEAMPGTDSAASYEQLEAVAGELPSGPPGDPAIVRLHEVVSHLAPDVSLDLRYLRLDADHVRIGGNVPTFDAVETLRIALARSPRLTEVAIAEMRARIDDAGVEFRIEGRWLAAGERPS